MLAKREAEAQPCKAEELSAPRQRVPEFFEYHIALSFWDRLLGLHARDSVQYLLFPRCRAVHGFGSSEEIAVIFLDTNGLVLSVIPRLGCFEVARHPFAAQVLEVRGGTQVMPGDRVVLGCAPQAIDQDDPRGRLSRSAPRGFSMMESLIALPIVVIITFLAIEIGMLWHAKFALRHAAVTAVRYASVHHASDVAIRDGLVQGLMPLVSKTDTLAGLPAALFQTGAEVAQGIAMGWLRWEVLSPTKQSFMDWGEIADPILSKGAARGEVEIPSSPLPALATRRRPASGTSSVVGGLPVGVASGQSLIEANTLKLNLKIGVPLRMPVAGTLLAKSLALWSGCGWSVDKPSDQIGLVDFGRAVSPSILSARIECRALAARDSSGHWQPRWPIETSALVHMQSNARRSLMVLRDRQLGVGVGSGPAQR